jgi:hypothetical protein
MASRAEGGVAALAVKVLYEHAPQLDAEAIAARVRQTLPKTVVVAYEPGVLLAHEDFPIAVEQGTKAILTMIGAPDADERGDFDLTQSWSFRDAADAVGTATATLLVAEMLGAGGPPQHRVRAFKAALEAVAELTRPLAIWSPAAQEMLAPNDLTRHALAGLVNVRLFQVEDEQDEMLMDTLGLHTLGLPDFQMHFRGLDETVIATRLTTLAIHVFEHPEDRIETGHTVSGPNGERWRVQFEQALAGPNRIVLDIDPGPPHAAGERG